MAHSIISMQDVVKTFRIRKKGESGGVRTFLKSLFSRDYEETCVLDKISLDIKEGEIVGYLGPNGAGKSTTIKILTGVLTQNSGSVDVAGFIPYRDRYEYTKHIGVVFGHRSLLEFDIPVEDSFLLYRDIYEIPQAQYEKRLAQFGKMLGIDELMHIPVRKLSLGQRMRCEIAASLLHKPRVVFLDEPTIGLDAVAKEEIRTFLREMNQKEKTTIVLTTHDMDDIEALCKRIVVIDKGTLIYDGSIEELKKKFIREKTVEFELSAVLDKRRFSSLLKKVTVDEQRGNFYRLRVSLDTLDVPSVVSALFSCCTIIDLLVHEPRLEDIIKVIYGERK